MKVNTESNRHSIKDNSSISSNGYNDNLNFSKLKKKRDKLESEIFDLELKIEDKVEKQLYDEILPLQKSLSNKYVEYEELKKLING